MIGHAQRAPRLMQQLGGCWLNSSSIWPQHGACCSAPGLLAAKGCCGCWTCAKACKKCAMALQVPAVTGDAVTPCDPLCFPVAATSERWLAQRQEVGQGSACIKMPLLQNLVSMT